jgi:hypothetical protein
MTCLDEAVPDPGAHRGAAVLRDDLGHGLGADQVVQDGGAGLLLEHALGHDGGGDVEPDTGCRGRRRGTPGRRRRRRPGRRRHPTSSTRACRSRWFSAHRVGGVVREGAVELAVHDLEVDGQALEHRRHDEARPCRWRCRPRPSWGTSASVSMKLRTWSANASSSSGHEGGEADPERVGDVSVELLGHRASDVVRLDDLVEDRHESSEASGRVRRSPVLRPVAARRRRPRVRHETPRRSRSRRRRTWPPPG